MGVSNTTNWNVKRKVGHVLKIEKDKETMQPAPPFKTVEEEAQYWGADDAERIRAEAKRIGVGPTTLARMWVLEHLRS